MSFIPSFILSALIFCNMTVPGGWDEAAFTEGIICEIPDVRFTLSLDESADQATPGRELLLPSLRNAALIWMPERLPAFKAAAGSLSVTGMNGSDTLSIALPARQDAAKPFALFLNWKSLSCLITDGRITAQFRPDLSVRLTAGWTRLDETKDSGWFLRYPWHQAGNLFWLNSSLTARFPFTGAHLETTGTAELAVTDILPPAAGGALTLLLKAGATETRLAFSAAPARFLTPAGTFTGETLSASALFTYSTTAATTAEAENKAAWAFKAGAAFADRQPASPRELSKRLFSADLAASAAAGSYSAGVSVSAAKLCFDDGCRDGELTAALDLSLPETSLSAKATFLPFKDASEKSKEPAWSLKALFPFSDGGLSCTADFSGIVLETLTFSLSEERDTVSFSTSAAINKDGLVWVLSYSKKW